MGNRPMGVLRFLEVALKFALGMCQDQIRRVKTLHIRSVGLAALVDRVAVLLDIRLGGEVRLGRGVEGLIGQNTAETEDAGGQKTRAEPL